MKLVRDAVRVKSMEGTMGWHLMQQLVNLTVAVRSLNIGAMACLAYYILSFLVQIPRSTAKSQYCTAHDSTCVEEKKF